VNLTGTQVEGPMDVSALCIHLGCTMLMQDGQPLMYDAGAASHYMRGEAAVRGTVRIAVRVGAGPGRGTAWGCDLSRAYVDINTAYN
jgi:glutamate N-acetyltransferase/amino-acid N-acetyltransferase